MVKEYGGETESYSEDRSEGFMEDMTDESFPAAKMSGKEGQMHINFKKQELGTECHYDKNTRDPGGY